MEQTPLPDAVSLAELAGIFDVTERQVRNLLSGAKIKPLARGLWPLGTSIRSIYAHARASRQSSELAKARARAINASARKTEFATAQAERKLIPIEDANMTIDAVCAAVQAELYGLPARLTRDRLEMPRIEAEVRATLRRISSALTAKAKRLRDGEIDDVD